MFKIDDSEVDNLEHHLNKFASRALPFATKQTLNSAAFHAQKEYKGLIKSKTTQRNKYTMQSIRVNQTKTLNISHQEAVIGSTANYMQDQEFGKVITGSIALATSYSAGQGPAEKRTRLPKKANLMQNIQLSRRNRKAKNRKQRNLFKVQDAVTTGKRVVYMDTGKRKGIFKIIGGKKNFKRGYPKGVKIKMLHDLSKNTVVIPKSPLLSLAVDKTQPLILDIYKKALMFQLRRNKILGY